MHTPWQGVSITIITHLGSCDPHLSYRTSILVHLNCYNNNNPPTPHRLGETTGIYFYNCGTWKSDISVWNQHSSFSVRAPFLVCRQPSEDSHCYLHIVEKGHLSHSLITRVLILFMRATPLWHNYFAKTLPLNSILERHSIPQKWQWGQQLHQTHLMSKINSPLKVQKKRNVYWTDKIH